MPKRCVHHASTDEEILEAIREAGNEENEQWVTIDILAADQRFLNRLDRLVEEGRLVKKKAWKNHAASGAIGLGQYIVGYDPGKYCFRIPPPPASE